MATLTGFFLEPSIATFAHPQATDLHLTNMESLLEAPGVVLAVHTDKTGTYVDGYREEATTGRRKSPTAFACGFQDVLTGSWR
jgi:hypothetical protein